MEGRARGKAKRRNHRYTYVLTNIETEKEDCLEPMFILCCVLGI